MRSQSILVRCPGCGNTTPVSMAVGQQLHCDVCHTKFYSPIITSDEPESTVATGSFVVNVPGEMSRHSDGAAPATHEQLPSEPAQLAHCDDAAQTKEWQPPEWKRPPETDPDTTSARRGVAPSVADRESAVESGEEDARGEPRGILWSIITGVAAVVILGTSFGAGLYLLRSWTNRNGPDQNDAPTPVVTAQKNGNQPEVKWTDASRFSQRRGPFKVKVERVTFGAVRAKNMNNEVITTEDDSLIAITVSVHNRGEEPQPFRQWYGNSFIAANGDDTLAELYDDQMRSYSQVRFDDVTRIEGQQLANRIAAGGTTRDTIVFAIPADVDRKAIEYFRLALPAAAVEASGTFRFQIRASMIEDF